jgi:hypothetical protein
MHAVHLLCPRTVVLNRGRVEYDGTTEIAVARYHQLTSQILGKSSRDTSVRVTRRRLLDERGDEVNDVELDQVLVYAAVIEFERSMDSPGVTFKLLAADGTIAYSMQTPVGERWRTYQAGESCDVRCRFVTRLGGGGTFHVNIDVVDVDNEVILSDVEGPAFYVPPRLGVGGFADVDARITVDDAERTNHVWRRLGGGQLISGSPPRAKEAN